MQDASPTKVTWSDEGSKHVLPEQSEGTPPVTSTSNVASGYVGQEVTSSSSITTVTTGSPTFIAATYTLPAGVWLVSGAVHVIDAISGGVTYVCVNTESSALAVGGGGIAQGALVNNQFVANSQPVVKVSSGSTVVNLYVFIAGTWQNGTDTLNTLIRAVRIA